MKMLVIDGNSIINRSYYALLRQPMTAPDGTPTGGVFGFLTAVRKYLELLSPDCVCAAFDLPDPTHRHKLYDGYKATRKGTPPELALQFPLAKEALRLLGISVEEYPGFEADDILGTYAASCAESGWECALLTGDRDSLQLVGGGVCVLLAGGSKSGEAKRYGEAEIMQEYGVPPASLTDVKALMGDTSDNIPGVAGIGEKTALSLIGEFKSLDSIYGELDTLPVKESVRTKLREGEASARLSRTLAEIRRDAPVRPKELTLRHTPDRAGLREFFTRLGFRSMLAEFDRWAGFVPDGNSAISSISLFDGISEITSQPVLKPSQPVLRPSQPVLEPAGDVPTIPDTGPDQAFFLSGRSQSNNPAEGEALDELWILRSGKISHIEKPGAEWLRDFFGDENIKKTGYYFKPVISALLGMGIRPLGMEFDLRIADYLTDSQRGGGPLGEILFRRLNADADTADWSRLLTFLPALRNSLSSELRSNGQEALFREVEMPLTEVLAKMELAGFAVDTDGLRAYGKEMDAQIAALTGRIYLLCGGKFNVNSPKQLAEVLFGRLGLKPLRKTKSGYSTDAEVLEKLRDSHAAIDEILSYRQLTKLKSTYVDGLLRLTGEDSRIRTVFHQTVVQTGRLSSAEPNLQNIPVRTAAGRELRRMFVAPEGCLLVDGDYSQIELRVLAHLSGDAAMAEAFRQGADIHRATAAGVFNVPPESVTPEMRSAAKTVNFGIIYGMGEFSLAGDLKISVSEAKEYIRAYFNRYPGVRAYMEETVRRAAETGYVTTPMGRRRSIPEIASANKNVRSFGERAARNTPVQGMAADIIKVAMIRVNRALESERLCARLILQVHDELILEAPAEESARAAELLREAMEGAADLAVPLTADIKTGLSWYDTK